MAKRFKGHAKGGRFKREEFGDLGLRAFEIQQNKQLQIIKDQRTQSQEYYSEGEQSMRDVASNEEKNVRDIKALQDAEYAAKRKNIAIAAEREIEAIKGKAKEYGKEAEFWKDFSTTYSKQYGELAQAATDLYERKVSANLTEKAEDSNYLDVQRDAAEKFNDEIGDNANKDKVKVKDREVSKSLIQTIHSTAPTHAKNISKDIEDNWSKLEQGIKDKYKDELTESKILEKYDYEVKEALKRAGVSPATKGYKEAVTFARSKAIAQQVSLRDNREIKETETDINETLKVFNSATTPEAKRNAFNSLTEIFDTGTFKGQYGASASRFVDRDSNLANAALKAAELTLWSKDYPSYEDWMNDTYNHAGFDGKATWNQRHGKNHETVLKELWHNKVDFDNKESTRAHEAKENAIYLETLARIENPDSVRIDPESKEEIPNHINVGDPTDNWAGRKELWKIMLSNPGNKKLQDLVTPFITYDPSSKVSAVNQMRMISALDVGDVKGFMSIYSVLSDTDRETFAPKHKIITDLQSIVGLGDVYSSSKKIATDKIKHSQKEEQLGSKKSLGEFQAINAYIQILHTKFAQTGTPGATGYIADPTERWQKAIEAVDLMVDEGADGGTGIFRRSKPVDTGGGVKWLTWVNENGTDPAMTLDFISNRARNSSFTYDKFINNLKTQDGSFKGADGYGYILSKDELDTVFIDLKDGRSPVRFNKNISHIANVYGKSVTDVWNDILNIEIPPEKEKKEKVSYVSGNDADHARLKLDTIPGFLSDPERYSDVDMIKIGGVADIFKATQLYPMKEHIRTWWGRKKINPDYISPENQMNMAWSGLEDFKLTTGIDYVPLPDGDVRFTDMEKALQLKDTWLTDYWYNPHTNTFVPNNPY